MEKLHGCEKTSKQAFSPPQLLIWSRPLQYLGPKQTCFKPWSRPYCMLHDDGRKRHLQLQSRGEGRLVGVDARTQSEPYHHMRVCFFLISLFLGCYGPGPGTCRKRAP